MFASLRALDDQLELKCVHLPDFKDHQPLPRPCVYIRLLPLDGDAHPNPVQLCHPSLVIVDRESSCIYSLMQDLQWGHFP